MFTTRWQGRRSRCALRPLARADGADCGRVADDAAPCPHTNASRRTESPEAHATPASRTVCHACPRAREVLPLAREVLAEFPAQRRQMSVAAGRQSGLEAAPQCHELLFEHPAIGELEQAHAVVGGAGDHRTKRRIQPGEADVAGSRPIVQAVCRTSSGTLRESRCATRSRSRTPHRPVIRRARICLERLREAARTAVGLERQPVTVREVAADARRLDAHGAQIALANARVRTTLHALEQTIHPRRRLVPFERPAAQAWAIAGEERLLRHGEELDVLRLWVSGPDTTDGRRCRSCARRGRTRRRTTHQSADTHAPSRAGVAAEPAEAMDVGTGAVAADIMRRSCCTMPRRATGKTTPKSCQKYRLYPTVRVKPVASGKPAG